MGLSRGRIEELSRAWKVLSTVGAAVTRAAPNARGRASWSFILMKFDMKMMLKKNDKC